MSVMSVKAIMDAAFPEWKRLDDDYLFKRVGPCMVKVYCSLPYNASLGPSIIFRSWSGSGWNVLYEISEYGDGDDNSTFKKLCAKAANFIEEFERLWHMGERHETSPL